MDLTKEERVLLQSAAAIQPRSLASPALFDHLGEDDLDQQIAVFRMLLKRPEISDSDLLETLDG